MTTESDLAAVQTDIDNAKRTIAQLEAANEASAYPYWSQLRSDALKRAGPFGSWWRVGGLHSRLTSLENNLVELRREKNLLLEMQRAESYAVVGTTRYFSDERTPQRRLPNGSLVDVPEDEGLVHLSAQRPRGAYRLNLRVPNALQLMQFRKSVFSWAQQSIAYYSHNDFYSSNDGSQSISYVGDDGDLEIDLFFPSLEKAEEFRNLVDFGLSKWHGAKKPLMANPTEDQSFQLDASLRVLADHYSKAPASPERDANVLMIERDESVLSDGTTTVITDPQVIALESWINPGRTHQPFHECHIDESIKRTKAKDQAIKDKKMDPYPEEDTAGNKIPLPIDWHFLYDRKGTTRPSYLSFKASELPCDSPLLEPRRHNGETYAPLQVDIFFHSDLDKDEITSLLRPVKNAQHVSGRIYRVHIFKREPKMFIRKTTERHDEIIATWP